MVWKIWDLCSIKHETAIKALSIHVQRIRFWLAVHKKVSHMTLHSSNYYYLFAYYCRKARREEKKGQPTKTQTHTKTAVWVLKCGKKKKLATTTTTIAKQWNVGKQCKLSRYSQFWVFCLFFFLVHFWWRLILFEDIWTIYKLMNSFLRIYHIFAYFKSTFSKREST